MALSPLRGAIRAARGIFASDENEKGALAGIPSFTDAMSNAGIAPDLAQMPARAKMPAEPPNWLDYIGLAGATLQEMGGVTGAVGDFTGRRKSMQQEGEMNQLLSELNLSDEELGLVSAGMGANVLADRVSGNREQKLYERGRADTVADRTASQNFSRGERMDQNAFEAALRREGYSREDAALAAEREYQARRDQRGDWESDRDYRLRSEEVAQAGRNGSQLGDAQLATIYGKANEYIAGLEEEQKNLDRIANEANAFLQLAYNPTDGGAKYTSDMGPLGGLSRMFDTRSGQLEQITAGIAPLMRQAGSGSSSDRDVEGFQKSVVNINKSEDANRRFAEGATLVQQRHKDYTNFLTQNVDINDPQSLQAAKAMWNAYTNANPLYDANGNPMSPTRNREGAVVSRIKSFDDWYDEQMNMAQQGANQPPAPAAALAPPSRGGSLLPGLQAPQQQGPEVFYRIENGRLVRN